MAIEEAVMIEKLKNPEMQMIDLFAVLQEDIDFAKSLADNLGDTKEENAVAGMVAMKLNHKVEFIGQMLKLADMNYSKNKVNFAEHYNHIKDLYNIKILIKPKEG